MFQKLKRKCRPTTILLAIGFSISIMSVLVGISAINDILTSLAEADQEAPIFNTMQNTGISLALSIYLFSIANCLVVTNYWIITKRRDMQFAKRSAGQIVTSFLRWYQKWQKYFLSAFA